MEMLRNPSYLLVTLSRSLDSSHFGKRIHMIGSAFYTTDYDFDSIEPRTGKNYIIIRLKSVYDENISSQWLDSKKNVIEVRLSLALFFEIYNGLGYPQFDNALKYLLGEIKEYKLKAQYRELMQIENVLSDALFVFEDITWFTLQLICKGFNIDLSGGTISKRYVLSTAQYNLSNYLDALGYSEQDVYNSYYQLRKLSATATEASSDLIINSLFNFNKDQMLFNLNKYLSTKIDDLNQNISNLESDIKFKGQNINSWKQAISTKIAGKLSKKKNIATKRILKNKENITNLEKAITRNQKEIPLLKSKLLDLNSEKEGLNNLSYCDLRNKYNLYCHNDIVMEKANIFTKGLLRLNNKNIKAKSPRDSNYFSRRKYSTLSNINGSNFPKNNLLWNKNVLNDFNYNLNLNKNNFNLKRSFSLFSNTSLFNDNLLKFIFSGEPKEKIQKDIKISCFLNKIL